MNTHEDRPTPRDVYGNPPAPPSDAIQVGDWMLDHDGYGRPFRGTVHGAVSICGYQHADGRVERTFHVTGGGELTLMGAYSLMGDLNAAAGEVEALAREAKR